MYFQYKGLIFTGEAVLLYEMKNGVMNMYETLVPEHHQGRGIAGVLAEVLVLNGSILTFLHFLSIVGGVRVRRSEQNPLQTVMYLPGKLLQGQHGR